MKKVHTNHAEICFKDFCMKLYHDNAKLINSIATATAVIVSVVSIIKAFDD